MKFGVREIVDVVFKATENGQRIGTKTFKKYQPVFMIDTATTSSLEQATTTVYAQGGKGYARLIAWEGEKTMTFTVTDALMSPMGLAVLTGAGLIDVQKAGKQAHFHVTANGIVSDTTGTVTIDFATIRDELGLGDMTAIDVCSTIEMYGTRLDGSGAGIDWYDLAKIAGEGEYVTVDEDHAAVFTIGNGSKSGSTYTFDSYAPKGATVQVDFYVVMNNALTQVVIEPSSFGGYFYVEAQTLFRAEATGKDMAAEITIPKAKVQSAFTFTMAASGDPSTFDFVMDAMPGYTRFDSTKKVMCQIDIVGTDSDRAEESAHTHNDQDANDTPSFRNSFRGSTATAVPAASFEDVNVKANQNKTSVAKSATDSNDNIVITIAGGTDSLSDEVEPKAGWGAAKWVAVDYNTGEDTIVGLVYKNRGTETTLGADDVADATEAGLPAGHMIVWVKADVAKATPATFQLAKGSDEVNVTITAKDGAAVG